MKKYISKLSWNLIFSSSLKFIFFPPKIFYSFCKCSIFSRSFLRDVFYDVRLIPSKTRYRRPPVRTFFVTCDFLKIFASKKWNSDIFERLIFLEKIQHICSNIGTTCRHRVSMRELTYPLLLFEKNVLCTDLAFASSWGNECKEISMLLFA